MMGPSTWVRQNLFSSLANTVLTVLALYLLYLLLPPLIQWALVNADWSGETHQDCTGSGACWVFIKVRLAQFLYGFYPEAERWRVNVVFVLWAGFVGFVAFPRGQRAWIVAFLLVVLPIATVVLLLGGI